MNNREYIENIQERMISYNDVREEAIAFIIENNIKNTDLVTHLLVIAHLWLANRREETLTEQEINIFLNSEPSIIDIKHHEFIQLSDEDTDMDLYELLEHAIDVWYSDEPESPDTEEQKDD